MEGEVVTGAGEAAPTSTSTAAAVSTSDVREGDWICPNCTANVFGRNISCFRCQSPKPGTNARHGDWVCLKKGCGAHNYASRQVCYRCQMAKGLEKPGDWACATCAAVNFASRHECFRCRNLKPRGYMPNTVGNVRPGDWLCPNPSCGCNVFANRDTCFRCNTAKPSDADLAASFSQVRPGDWSCPNCQAMCFQHRQSCFRCNTPKPDSESTAYAFQPTYSMAYLHPQHIASASYYAAQGYPTQPAGRAAGGPQQFQKREGDWTCANCKEENFARRNVCFKCHQAKPSVSDASKKN